jgi:hypothetical protein
MQIFDLHKVNRKTIYRQASAMPWGSTRQAIGIEGGRGLWKKKGERKKIKNKNKTRGKQGENKKENNHVQMDERQLGA